MKWIGCLILFWLSTAESALNPSQLLLTAIWYKGTEEEIDAYQDGDEYWLPLKPLAELTGFKWQKEKNIHLDTPLGSVSINHYQIVDEQIFISTKDLKQKLKFQIRFDQGQYAFILATPWSEKKKRFRLSY